MDRKALAIAALKLAVILAIYLGIRTFFFEPDIVFVLPEDFRGPFIVIEHAEGVDLKSERGTFTVEVPPSRVVRVRSFTPFNYMHKDFVSVLQPDGGRSISLVNLDPQATEVALRCLGTWGGSTRNGTIKQERLAYYLGTEAEAESFDFYSIDVD